MRSPVKAAIVSFLLAWIHRIDAHSTYVGCPLPMAICGHGAQVFPGSGIVSLSLGNAVLPCGSFVTPDTNFTIMDRNTSGIWMCFNMYNE